MLLGAAALRFWALDHGIPFSVGVDEPEIMERAVRVIKTGDFNPHFFDYPGLYIYLQAAVAALRFIWGALHGAWTSLDGASSADFYLWARAVTAALGVATVGVVFACGLRWGYPQALLASLFIAVMPLHVRESHYALTDVPVTFFVAWTLLLSLRAHERAAPGAFAAAGAAAGLACATKYPGGLAALLPLLAWACTRLDSQTRWRAAAATLGSFTAAFLLAAPYTILALPAFLEGFAHLSSAYTPKTTWEPGWMIYLKHLRINLGPLSLLLVGTGAVVAAIRLALGPSRARWALVLIFPIVYCWFISRQGLIFARYILPSLPFVALLGGIGVMTIVRALQRFIRVPGSPRAKMMPAIVGVALGLVLIGKGARVSIAFDAGLARPNTIALAYDRIRREIPPGSYVVVESRALLLPPTYRSRNIPQLRAQTLDQYRAEGVQYLLASSQGYGPVLDNPQAFASQHADYARLFGEAREVWRIAPTSAVPGPELRLLRVGR